MTTFSVGVLSRQPSWLLPDLMAMVSWSLVETTVFHQQVEGHLGIDAPVVVAVRPNVDAADADGFG